MEAILSNPYASGGKKNSRKSNLPDIDFKTYAAARVGMWMFFISWTTLLACMVLIYVLDWLGRLAPDSIGKMFQSTVYFGLSWVILGLMFLSLAMVLIGQIICIAAPIKDEKLFAGLAVGTFVAAVILPVVGFFIGAFEIGVAGSTGIGKSAVAVIGLPFLLVVAFSCVLALSSMFFFISYFRRVGKNIRSKEVAQLAKPAMTTWTAAIVVAILCSIAIVVLYFMYPKQPEWFPTAVNLIGLVNAILGFAVMGLLIGMVMKTIEKTKVV